MNPASTAAASSAAVSSDAVSSVSGKSPSLAELRAAGCANKVSVRLDFETPQGFFSYIGPVTVANFYIEKRTYPKIGTDGLATCVGLLIRYNNDAFFCAHIDASYEPRTYEEITQFSALVAALLLKVSISGIQSVNCSTTSRERSTKLIVEGIELRFPNVDKKEGTLLYFDGVKVVASNANVANRKDNVFATDRFSV